MVKKTVALLCTALLLLGCTGAGMAEEESVNESRKLTDQIDMDVTPGEAASSDESDAFDIPEKSADITRAADAQRSVYINGNSYIVEILSSLNLIYEAPAYSSVVCFTQDYAQQANLYNLYYSSPVSAAFNYIDEDIFFNIYDPTDGMDIYVCVTPSPFSSSFPNMSALSDGTVASMLYDIWIDTFPTAVDKQYGWVGGNVYLFFNLLNNGRVELLTTVNGYQIEVFYDVKTQDDVLKGLTLLDYMSILPK